MLRRLLESLGLLEESPSPEEREVREETAEERRGRVLREPVGSSRLLICRPAPEADGRERMVEALNEGRLVLFDLRRLEREEGQGLLDFLSGVAYALRGTVLRVGPGIFLATPKRFWIESWDASEGEDGGDG